MSTRTRSIKRLMHLTIVAGILMSSLMAARPAAAAVAGEGTGYQASVICDSFGGLIRMSAVGSAAPGYSSQWIRYRYYIQDAIRGTTIAGWNPSGWGQFQHIRQTSTNVGGVSMSASPYAFSGESSLVVPHGRYFIWTQHQFWNGYGWVGAAPWIQTASYTNLNNGGAGYCYA